MKEKLISGLANVLETPINERYCKVGDIATLDVENKIHIMNKYKLNQLKEKLANDKKYLVLIQGMRNSLDTLETKMKFREMIRETNIEIEKTQNDIYKFMGFNFK